jgi:hypothetical protein
MKEPTCIAGRHAYPRRIIRLIIFVVVTFIIAPTKIIIWERPRSRLRDIASFLNVVDAS